MVPLTIRPNVARAVSLLALCSLLGACAIPVTPTYPRPTPAPAPVPPPARTVPPATPTPTPPVPPTPAPTPPAAPRPAPSVTLALVEESDAARARGDYDKAVALLERAIRIEPDRPELWLSLAKAHLAQGDYAAAEQLARKSLLFTGKRYDLEQQAWSVIGAAEAARRQDRQL
jgi:uncharacterized protein HemY